MNAMKFLKRSLFFLGLVSLILFVAGAVLIHSYQEELVERFIGEANKGIDTPIHAGSIKASWWAQFPNVAIVLADVRIDGSLPGTTDTLAAAQKIYCTFNAWEILKGNWVVDEIHMEQGKLFLVQTELGDNNFTIINRDTSRNRKTSAFKLDRILLDEVAVTYFDLARNQEYYLQAHEVTASLDTRDQLYNILLNGSVTSKDIVVQNYHYLTNKPMHINGELKYHQPDKKWEFLGTEIVIDQSAFLVNGYYTGSSNDLDISVKGHNTSIKTVLSLLPESISNKYNKYQSKGEIYFEARLNGSVADGSNPQTTIDFGCKNASFFHPEYKKGIEGVYLTGKYHSDNVTKLSTATLSLNGIKGVMEEQAFSGNLKIRNLEKYHIDGDFKGTFDLDSWHQFLPQSEVTAANGTMKVDISFSGPVNYLKSAASMDKFKTSGEIFVENMSFSLERNSLPFEHFNGHFLFNGRDLAISDFKGNIGNSDFQINGFFRNIIAFVFSKNQPIGIEADLQANTLDLDELLTGNTKDLDKTVVGKQSYTSFEINPRLALIFNCNVDQLKFRRFRGHQIKGNLRISNQVAHGEQISFNTMGGKIVMNGRVDGRIKDHIRVQTKSSYEGIYIDSLFYVFENFRQDFLEDHHLNGQAFADIDTYMAFDEYLRFKSPDLVVDAGLIIENGELNEFEPLQKLSTYVDSQDLRHLKFADLKNNIQIKDRKIFLPNMVVQSNLTTIAVNGTHTFDQLINYRLKVPIKSTKKDKDEYFGALEDDGSSTNLFLKITGNTKDYQVVYDKEAVKDKIKQDLREEKWEIRDAVRNKGADTSAQELDEEDFFDFEEADSTALQN
ncbi:MAG: hypothetical protein DHS20C17_12890 [Cyclobacteriaceae bacterium]|nr:MAG: hypothetical protein DHS20C17_12890 [Cyclobacteriaceae bacterium]